MELKTQLNKRCAFLPTGMLTREAEDGKKTIEGVAIVTNTETVLWEDADWREVEVIDPACIAQDFIINQDIKLNLLHERTMTFARCNKGVGSLKLEAREDGLAFSAPGNDSDYARLASDLIANGTYTGCSFEFWPQDYTIEERKGADGKDEYVIRHTKFKSIEAITIGMDPAYPTTSVNAREIYNREHPATATIHSSSKEGQTEPAVPTEEETLARRLRELQSDIDAEYALMARE